MSEIHKFRFFGCYLLVSDNETAPKGRSYIGFTVEPARRIRQHNGELACGGARRTKLLRPWRMVCIVHGFRSQVQGLQFEWGWQNPLLFRSVRTMVMAANIRGCKLSSRGRQREMRVETNLEVLAAMLSSPPWSRMPLSVTFFDESLRKNLPVTFPSSIVLNCHTSVQEFSLGDFVEPEKQLLVKNGSCCQCQLLFSASSTTRVVACPGCGAFFHPRCASAMFAGRREVWLVPDSAGACSACDQMFMWTHFVKTAFIYGEPRNELLEESESEESEDEPEEEGKIAFLPTQVSPGKFAPESSSLRERLFQRSGDIEVFQI